MNDGADPDAGDDGRGLRALLDAWTVGDPATHTVDKGATTRSIIAAPEGDGQDASAVIPS
jgi:hypothetical protein